MRPKFGIGYGILNFFFLSVQLQVDQHIKITGTKSLDPGLEILTAPSTNQEGRAVRFRLKLRWFSVTRFDYKGA